MFFSESGKSSVELRVNVVLSEEKNSTQETAERGTLG
jgi:hypothetical protein